MVTPPKPETLASLIHLIRGEKIILDADLAPLYRVPTGALNRAVKRNLARFPADFMFQLTPGEWRTLQCQTGISKSAGRRARPKLISPSCAPLSSCGGSWIRIDIWPLRSDALEKRYDEQIALVFDAITKLIADEDVRKARPQRKIGFIS